VKYSLRSKRFRRFFHPFKAMAFSLFDGTKIGASATPESEKCFKPAESPMETLATQAR